MKKISLCFLFLFISILLSACSNSEIINDTPPSMMPRSNVFTIENDTDIVYRGEEYGIDDLVYRGEKLDVKPL